MSFPPYVEYKESGVAWLGAVPSHWKVVQSRRYFALRKDRASDGDRQLTASQKWGVIYQDDFMEREGQRVVQVILNTDILKKVEPNDFVISMRSFQGGIEWCGLGGSISSAYVMLIPKSSVGASFFSYLFKSRGYIQALQSTSNLVRDGQALRYENFVQVPLPLPPLAEQEVIAGFLDRETAKIDGLVAEQERLIALLKEKRQAVISHAVTKGLNPDAPLKDSGIEWLGQIPEHWEATAMKRVIEMATSGPRGWSELAAENGSFFFQSQNIGRNMEADFSAGKRITVPDGPDAERAKLCVDDVVVCITGGRTGAVAHIDALEEDAFINQHVCLIRPIDGHALGRYLAYGLFGLQGQEQLGIAMYGLKQGLNLENVREVLLPLPPISDQAVIVEYLDDYSDRVLELQQEAQSAIILLQERRAALISAAVTGKIDVRATLSRDNVVSIRQADAQPNFPSLRAVVGAYAIRALGPKGRMAVMKGGFLAEAHAGLHGIGGHYERYAAGPYDRNLITAMEQGAHNAFDIQTVEATVPHGPTIYRFPKGFSDPSAQLTKLVGAEKAKSLQAMLTLLTAIDREGVEAVATLYSVWNDLLASGQAATDDTICHDFLTNWDPEKPLKFKKPTLIHWLGWMHRHGFVPDGSAPRTDHQGSLFA